MINRDICVSKNQCRILPGAFSRALSNSAGQPLRPKLVAALRTSTNKEKIMTTPSQILRIASILTMTAALGACANMSATDQNTAIGAGIGAVAGSALTGGNAAATVGGAVVGGVIGNKVKR